MSGHSKWATIKHKKAALDAKKGAVFTKLGNAITIAVRQGGTDATANFGLRLAVEKARAVNMPKENIERAIKKGSGELDSENLEEALYEGILPGNIPILIKVVTDNKNRTLTDIKTVLTKNGGQLVVQNAISWQFELQGAITINNKQITINKEELELKLIDAGAEDIEHHDELTTIYTNPTQLQQVKNNIEQQNLSIKSAELEYVAKEKVDIDEETGNKIQKIFELLDDLADISDYYTNLK